MATDENIDGFRSEHEDNDVSALCGSSCYPEIKQKFEELLKDHEVPSYSGVGLADKVEDQVIFDCIRLLVDIEDSVYAFFRQKVPEAESLVTHPIDIVRAVKKAGFEIVDEACDQVLDLVSLRKRLLDFVDSRMVYLAPNLSAIVGTTVAAKLMVAAGGLELLGKMIACNVQLLGSQRRNLDGLSTQLHFGYLQESDILQTFPSALTTGASRVLASTCSTAARIDSMGKDLTGNTGKNLREVVINKIKRYCEAEPTENFSNPLPSQARNNRAVRGVMNFKNRYATTDKRILPQFEVLKEISLDSRKNTTEAASTREALVELSKRTSCWELQGTHESKQELRTSTAEGIPDSKALADLSGKSFMPGKSDSKSNRTSVLQDSSR